MEWSVGKIEKLFEFADFSKETDLKKSLIRKIMPVRELSLDDLKERVDKSTGVTSHEKKARVKHTPSRELENADAMNNDRPILPGGR